MTISFRPAQPDDVTTAVPLIYSSGPPTFDYVFKRDKVSAQEFLERAFVDGRTEFGYQNHTVAVENGQIMGIGALITSQTNFDFTINAVRLIMKTYGLSKGFGVIRCGLKVEQVIPPPKKGLAILVHLGVSPEKRSQGIGTKLIDYLTQEAKKTGLPLLQLDVSVENPRAQALYERLGFAVIKERPSTLANGYGSVADLRRMSRPLID